MMKTLLLLYRWKILKNILIFIILCATFGYFSAFIISFPFTDNKEIQQPFFKVKHKFDCCKFFANQFEPNSDGRYDRPLNTVVQLRQLFADCSALLETHYYPRVPLSKREAEFPLAYVLIVNEHLEQVEMLLNSIYTPQNVYCIHVDVKSPYFVHEALQLLADCFHNVFLPKDRISVSRSGADMLRAQRICLKLLFYGNTLKVPWKYVITLQGHDFPLRTNREIVEILKIQNGANDVELLDTPYGRYVNEYFPIYDEFGFEIERKQSRRNNELPPHGLTIYKGSFSTILNRETVEFSLESNIALDFLDWLGGTYMPDEIFWSTLNHNEFLNVSGGYPGRCAKAPNMTKSWISRFSIWSNYSHVRCNGKWRNNVCLFNCRDLPTLSARPELFLNKFWIQYDPVALDCMHELIFNRTFDKEPKFELDYYRTLSSVVYHKWKKDNPGSNNFHCVPCRQCLH